MDPSPGWPVVLPVPEVSELAGMAFVSGGGGDFGGGGASGNWDVGSSDSGASASSSD